MAIAKTTTFIVYYWDFRGAWREWDEYKALEEAKKATKEIEKGGSKWILERRESTILAQSEDADGARS